MKRAGGLFERIIAWENLERSARKARRGKRFRLYVEEFELKRETIIRQLHDELASESWRPQTYRTFTIYDPKQRLVSAPAYRDRIVHHALCNVIAPVLERSMSAHSYSCRVGMGTGAARRECKRLVARYRYVLKMDVQKYFPSIDHAILKGKLARVIKCPPTLRLIGVIIDTWRDGEEPPRWFPGDDLLAPACQPHGLPIGALTSQLLANLYLTRLDHLIEEHIKPSGYVRYTDDLLLFSDSKDRLKTARERLVREMVVERLKPHPTKCRVHACKEGVPFLGFRYYPDRVRVIRANRIRFERRMRRMSDGFKKKLIDLSHIWASRYGWIQFVREYPSNEGLVRMEYRRHALEIPADEAQRACVGG